MQSGISASDELHTAFNGLVGSSDRGLLVGIKNEKLVPLETIPSKSSDFSSDLSGLNSVLKDSEAAYIIIRRYPSTTDPFVAVTYVPDTANVRSKMLFASTRLTLVRELGTEKFRETLFATTKAELTADGFRKHDKHGELKAPLTEEEETLQKVKDAEAEASRGTATRASHVTNHFGPPLANEAEDVLKGLGYGSYNLVQLNINIDSEIIELAGTASVDVDDLQHTISADQPRYSFFRYEHEHEGQDQAPVLFIYTCPTTSKVKERMIYAASRAGLVARAERELGLKILKRLEASEPSELSGASIQEDLHPKKEEKAAFSRPKRPGRR